MMTIAVPFWGIRPDYLALLIRWIEAYHTSKTPGPFVIVTPLDTPPPCGYPLLQVDLSGWRHVIRKDHPMDQKGPLILEAMKFLRPGVLFLDADAFPLLPVTDKTLGTGWNMSQDTGPRRMKLPWSDDDFKEHCAGVQWFGRDASPEMIGAKYLKAFQELEQGFPDEPLLEQLAWSLAHHRMNRTVLSRAWGHHPKWWKDNPDAIILHLHGHSKWQA
jgi:hypothetical protein